MLKVSLWMPDVKIAPKVVKDYKLFRISNLIFSTRDVGEIARKINLSKRATEVKVHNFIHHYTRYMYQFDSRGGETIRAGNVEILFLRMKRAGYYVASSENIAHILRTREGIYSYRGTYIGQFMRVRLVRRLQMNTDFYKRYKESK